MSTGTSFLAFFEKYWISVDFHKSTGTSFLAFLKKYWKSVDFLIQIKWSDQLAGRLFDQQIIHLQPFLLGEKIQPSENNKGDYAISFDQNTICNLSKSDCKEQI